MSVAANRLRYLSDVVSLKLDVDRCTGCGRCVEVCPRTVLKMENKRAFIVDRDLCIECGACAKNCEPGALSVHEGVGCAAAIINGMLTGGEPTCDCSGPGPESNTTRQKSCC